MRWKFWKPPSEVCRYFGFAYADNGTRFDVGDVVRHKVAGEKFVVIAFDESDGQKQVVLSNGLYSNNEFKGVSINEIEAYREPAKVAAVDPGDGITTG